MMKDQGNDDKTPLKWRAETDHCFRKVQQPQYEAKDQEYFDHGVATRFSTSNKVDSSGDDGCRNVEESACHESLPMSCH
jgi:hypothetical protein